MPPPNRNPVFETLPVFRAAIEVGRETYAFTTPFPTQERYGLTSQLRRASASVVANIAEGWSRRGRVQSAAFMDIAFGSLRELEALAVFSFELHVTDEASLNALRLKVDACSRQLIGLIRALRCGETRRQPRAREA